MGAQEELEKAVGKLSQPEFVIAGSREKLEEYAVRFCELYKDESFRHQYSGISRLIYGDTTPQRKEEFDGISLRADRLVNNLGTLHDYVEATAHDNYLPSECQCVCRKFAKLYDHVYLEYSRLLLLDAPYRSAADIRKEIDALDERAFGLDGKTKGLRRKTKAVSREVDGLRERLGSAQKDYIAILAIFAAVIMAFSGGFSFLTASLSEIATVSLPKLTCGVSLVGLVLIDLLYIMFRFVWGIIRSPGEKKGLPLSNAAIVLMNAIFIILFVGSLAVVEGWINF